MRNIINISLPVDLADSVRKDVKRGKFASTSEYFRYLVRSHKLAEELQKERRMLETGKGKVLRSLRDLR